MNLSDAGERRLHGYLFVLQRSLPPTVPAAVVADITSEIESHLRERVAASAGAPDEAAALERLLDELGTPERIARAYAAERLVEEALVSGRIPVMARALARVATTAVGSLLAVCGLAAGYGVGGLFLVFAVLRLVFPDNVGLYDGGLGIPSDLTMKFPSPAVPAGGSWLAPLCVIVGLALLVVTHRATRALLSRWSGRRRVIERVPA